MTTFIGTALSGAETQIDGRAIDDLARDLTRPPILPGSADYEEARRVFNKLIDKKPALIVRCGGVADVLRAVRFARDHDLLVAVRGGGHNAAGFATCDARVAEVLKDRDSASRLLQLLPEKYEPQAVLKDSGARVWSWPLSGSRIRTESTRHSASSGVSISK